MKKTEDSYYYINDDNKYYREKSKIKKLLWLIIRPWYYAKLFNIARDGIKKLRSSRWCNKRSISCQDAIAKITGNNEIEPIEYIYENELLKAKIKAKEKKVKMGGGGDINLIYHLCEYVKASKVIETGVAFGWSSLAILLSITMRNPSKLVSVDIPYSKETEAFVGCVVPDYLKDNWTIIKKPDTLGVDEAIAIMNVVDFVHYDSDKSYEGRMKTYPKLWKSLRKGGVFISDDVGDNMAFKNFVDLINKPYFIVKSDTEKGKKKYIGIVINN